MAGTIDKGTAPAPAPHAPVRHPRRWLRIAGYVGAGIALVGIGAGIGSAGKTTTVTKTVTVTKNVPVPGPTVTVTKNVPGPTKIVYKDRTVYKTKTVYAPLSAAPGHVLISRSGSGEWNSEPFTVTGDSPVLKVTYSYWGNSSGYGGDNFIAHIDSASDMNSVANTIATSGGKTTMIYPDLSSGDTAYHLEVQATGQWSFTITQVS